MPSKKSKQKTRVGAPDLITHPLSGAGGNPAEKTTTNHSPDKATKTPYPTVGLGASAGGLKALKEFFQACPDNLGLAYVVVMHMEPNSESRLVEILAQHTSMPVTQALDGIPVDPNTVYVIPPYATLIEKKGHLYLFEPENARGRTQTIDVFFRSLAEAKKEQAIAIVLSGAGSDGSIGAQAVKMNNGTVIVQDPSTAEHGEMPQNVISAGVEDYVVPPAQMPLILRALADKTGRDSRRAAPLLTPEALTQLSTIVEFVSKEVGQALNSYKQSTLTRRIQRRMSLLHLDAFTDYLLHLQDHPGEAHALYNDLLIGVTQFFREPASWKILEDQALKRIVEEGSPEDPVRVWVPGCATGEEAYTVAIELLEQIEKQKKNHRIQIFATDMDKSALDFAREGLYPAAIVDHIPPALLHKYFTKAVLGYKVNKLLRDSVVFSVQNLLSDPPFSKMNLITCRNVMIYLEPEAQKKLTHLFHFSLDQGGFLFLGSSETIGKEVELFEAVSKKWRIYRRIGSHRRPLTHVHVPYTFSSERRLRLDIPHSSQSSPVNRYADLAQRELLRRYVPASLLIDSLGKVLYYHGPHEKYILQPSGEPTHDLIEITREGLRTRLRNGLQKAVKSHQEIVLDNLQVIRDGASYPVRVTISPLKQTREADGLLLITFEDLTPGPDAVPKTPVLSPQEESLVRQLEEELHTTKEDLHCCIQDLETSNDDLKASNEEIMSMNEEFQSTNEELETSKEELQSLNEELSTLNSELQDKISEIESSNNDIINLLTSTNIATLFLDTNFCIRRYTPSITQILNLIPFDVGRRITDISLKVNDANVLLDAQKVLDTLVSSEREITDDAGRWYIRRIQPYRTHDNRIDGVVVTYTDVTEIKTISEALRIGEERFRITIHGSPITVFNQDRELRYTWVYNPTGFNNEHEMIGKTDLDLLYNKGEAIILEDLKRRVIESGASARQEVRITLRNRIHYFDLTVEPRRQEDGAVIGITGATIDITARKQAEEALRESEARFRRMADAAPVLIWISGPDKKCTYFNRGWLEFTGRSLEQELGDGWTESIHPDDYDRCLNTYVTSFDLRKPFQMEYRLRHQDGQYRWIYDHGIPLLNPDGSFNGFIGSCIDITDRRQIEEALHQSEERLQAALAAADMGTWRWEIESDRDFWDANLCRLYGLEPVDSVGDTERFNRFVHPDDRDRVCQEIHHALHEGDKFESDYRVVRPDGSVIWVRDRGRVFNNMDGKPIYMTGAVLDITEIKKSTESLEQAHRRMIEMVESIADGFIMLDREMRYTYMNHSAAEMLCSSPQDLIGKTLAEANPQSNWAEFYQYAETASAQNQPVHFEIYSMVMNEWLEMHLYPNVEGFSLFFTNISERKKSQLLKQESDEILGLALTGSGSGFWYIELNPDRPTQLPSEMHFSPQQKRIIDFEPDEFPDTLLEWQKRIHPADLLILQQRLHDVLFGKSPRFEMEYRIRHRNGTYRWILSRASIRINTEIRSMQLAGIDVDITERKQNFDRLAHLANLVETTDDAIYTKTIDGIITSWNAGAEKVYGYTAQEIIGQSVTVLLPPSQKEEYKKYFERILQGERLEQLETVRMRKDGTSICVSLTISPLRDESGVLYAFSTIARDISERIQAEQEIKHLNLELQRKVEELETIYNEAPIGINVAMDPECRVITSNLRGHQILGTTPKSNISLSLIAPEEGPYQVYQQGRLLAPEDLPLQTAVRTGEAVLGFECEIQRRDGEWRALIVHSIPLLDEKGGVRGCVGIYDDITDRKQTEEQIRRLNLELQHKVGELEAIFNVAPIGIAIASDPDCNIIQGNPAANTMLGVPLERNISKTADSAQQLPFTCYHKGREVPPNELPMQVAATQNRSITGYECDVTRQDGSVLNLYEYASPLYDEQNRVRGSLGIFIDITERKQSELRLHQANQVLQTLINSCPLAIIVLDGEGRVQLWNPTAERIFGWSADEVYNQFLPTVPDDLREEFYLHLAAVNQNASLRGLETERITRTGERLDVNIWATVFPDDQGQSRFMSLIADVTERRRMEEELRLNEERFRTTLKNAPITVFNQDRNLRYTWIYKQTSDLTYDQVIGHDDVEIMAGSEDADLLTQIKQNVMNTQIGYHGEVEVTISNEIRYFDLTVDPMLNRDNEVVGITGAAVDVTNLRRAAQALQQSESRYRGTFDNAAVGIAHLDANGRWMQVNQKLCDILGYTPDELIDKSIQDLTHPDDLETGQYNFLLLMDGEIKSYSTEIRMLHKNNFFLWTHLTAALQTGPQVRADYSICIIQDISSRKQAEEQLRELNENLEHHVLQRTQSLVRYQEQLRDLATELTRTEQRERRRLAGELHDYLAQLLVVCRLNLNRMLKDPQSDKVPSLATEVDQMLDESLRYTRTLIADLSPTILYDAGLIAALKWLAKQMENRNLTVMIEHDGDEYPMPDDHSILLFQAIRELLLNVVKHAQTDKAKVELCRESPNALTVIVSDQGAGFDLDSVQHNPLTPGHYGLFNVQERLEAIGGTYVVESAPGEGTLTLLTVPLKPYNPQAILSQPLHPKAVGGHRPPSPSSNEPIRVMLADDHNMVREGLRKILESYPKIQVIGEAADGEEIIAMAGTMQPEVIVMDINMPKKNGIEATKIIKNQWPHILIIGLSVHDDRELAAAMKDAGALAYLIKGGPSELLYQAILETRKR